MRSRYLVAAVILFALKNSADGYGHFVDAELAAYNTYHIRCRNRREKEYPAQ